MASTSNPLAAAQAALGKAKDFTKSVEGREPSMFAPKSEPVHEYSSTPYSFARSMAKNVDEYKKATKKASDTVDAKGDTDKGLSERAKNVDEYMKATKQ